MAVHALQKVRRQCVGCLSPLPFTLLSMLGALAIQRCIPAAYAPFSAMGRVCEKLHFSVVMTSFSLFLHFEDKAQLTR